MLLMGDKGKLPGLVVASISKDGKEGPMEGPGLSEEYAAAEMAIGDKILSAIQLKDPKKVASAVKDLIYLCEAMEGEAEDEESDG